MLLAKYFQTGIASGPRLEIRRTVTHETVLQADDIAMIDRLQDVDLALEILEQLGGEFLSADRFDSDKLVRLLLVYMMRSNPGVSGGVSVEEGRGKGKKA